MFCMEIPPFFYMISRKIEDGESLSGTWKISNTGGKIMERYIVVDNVCGWPKLTLMDDGSINLDVHNRPYHGSCDGSAECWKSIDGGKMFEKIGVSGAGSMEEGPFIDKACGVAHNGDYIVAVEKRTENDAYIFRSTDGGKTFTETGKLAMEGAKPIPYGKILRLGEKTLVMSYWYVIDKEKKTTAKGVREEHIRISRDDGFTWEEDYLIDEGINETALWFFDDSEGIAVGRADELVEGNQRRGDAGNGNRLYRTTDGGKTWQFEGCLLGHQMIPVDLLQLSDGSLLMTFGFRFANMGGVMACISKDKGATWSDPNILVHYSGNDGGYPSTVQLSDGTLVTAYYSDGNDYHTRYHVGVIRWKTEELIEAGWVDRPAKFYYGTDKEYIFDRRMNG